MHNCRCIYSIHANSSENFRFKFADSILAVFFVQSNNLQTRMLGCWICVYIRQQQSVIVFISPGESSTLEERLVHDKSFRCIYAVRRKFKCTFWMLVLAAPVFTLCPMCRLVQGALNTPAKLGYQKSDP